MGSLHSHLGCLPGDRRETAHAAGRFTNRGGGDRILRVHVLLVRHPESIHTHKLGMDHSENEDGLKANGYPGNLLAIINVRQALSQ